MKHLLIAVALLFTVQVFSQTLLIHGPNKMMENPFEQLDPVDFCITHNDDTTIVRKLIYKHLFLDWENSRLIEVKKYVEGKLISREAFEPDDNFSLHNWEEYEIMPKGITTLIYDGGQPLPVYKRVCRQCHKEQTGRPLIKYE